MSMPKSDQIGLVLVGHVLRNHVSRLIRACEAGDVPDALAEAKYVAERSTDMHSQLENIFNDPDYMNGAHDVRT